MENAPPENAVGASVTITNLTKRFGEFTARHNFAIDIVGGESRRRVADHALFLGQLMLQRDRPHIEEQACSGSMRADGASL